VMTSAPTRAASRTHAPVLSCSSRSEIVFMSYIPHIEDVLWSEFLS
jgi:hypothetical protein